MRADEIREMGSEDITSRIRELEEERFRLKFRSATEPLEDPLRLRVIRKDVARLQFNEEVQLFMRFRDFVGRHPMHCHNLVHEDHRMMLRWDIVP